MISLKGNIQPEIPHHYFIAEKKYELECTTDFVIFFSNKIRTFFLKLGHFGFFDISSKVEGIFLFS